MLLDFQLWSFLVVVFISVVCRVCRVKLFLRKKIEYQGRIHHIPFKLTDYAVIVMLLDMKDFVEDLFITKP